MAARPTICLACLTLSVLFVARASAQCEYAGESRLTVVPSGLEGSLLRVTGPVLVRPTPRGQAHEVEVRTNLSFVGETRDVRYSLQRRLETGHGMVSLGAAAEVQSVHARGDGLRFRTQINHYISIGTLDAECDDLRLFTQPPRRRGPELDYEGGDGTLWAPLAHSLRLRAAPGRGGAIRVRVRDRRMFIMNRMEVRGSWFRVLWSDRYHRVSGWARREDLRPTHNMGFGGTGGSGVGRCVRGRVSGTGIYQGPAEIRPGALVRQAPHGRVWATVRAPEGFEVLHMDGSSWVRIEVASGIENVENCGALESAWVRGTDVEFPVPRSIEAPAATEPTAPATAPVAAE